MKLSGLLFFFLRENFISIKSINKRQATLSLDVFFLFLLVYMCLSVLFMLVKFSRKKNKIVLITSSTILLTFLFSFPFSFPFLIYNIFQSLQYFFIITIFFNYDNSFQLSQYFFNHYNIFQSLLSL